MSMKPGRRKPSPAASPPHLPPAKHPKNMHSSVASGPGRIWYTAKTRLKRAIVIHCSLTTRRSLMSAIEATGPPQAKRPNVDKKNQKMSRIDSCGTCELSLYSI